MRILAILLLAVSSASASTDQCPEIRGTFLCPGVAGGANETTVLIQTSKSSRWMTYWYTWEEEGESPVEGSFVANDQGRRQLDDWTSLGKCVDGRFFVAPYGEPKWETRIVRVNEDGDYEATRHGDGRVFICPRLR